MWLFDARTSQELSASEFGGSTLPPLAAHDASRALRDRPHLNGRASDLEILVQGYRLYAKAEGKSPNTIALTTTAVGILRNFLEQDRLSTDVTQITAHELRLFALYLQQAKVFRQHSFARPQERRLSPHTVNCYLRAIRAFWSWLESEEIIEVNPFSKVRIPRPPRKVIPTFSEAQIKSLLGAIDISTATGYRDWTIILALLDTGLRVSEVASLKLEDVNLDQMLLKVWGKGSKERIVPIGVRVQRAMWKYLQRCRPEPASPRFSNFFLTRGGQPMSKGRIETQIKVYGEKADIAGVRCSPHTFRHTFAVTYLRNGGDVFSLQGILGHSSLDTVRVYINLASTDIQAAHRRYSPADNMDLKVDRKRTAPKKPRYGGSRRSCRV